MKFLVIPVLFVILLLGGCTKPAPPVKYYYLSQEMMAYFQNNPVGTCWVYKDTLHPGIYDTIELTRNQVTSFSNGDVGKGPATFIEKGYLLEFKTQRIQNFWMMMLGTSDSSSQVVINDRQSGEGDISTTVINGKWPAGQYRDSMKVGDNTYHDVLDIHGYCADFSDFVYAKNIGLVSYQSQGVGLNIRGGIYVLVKKFKK